MIAKTISAAMVAIRRFGWLPAVVFLAHVVCAHVVDVYRLWPPVDIPLHFAGGFAIAFFISGTLETLGDENVVRRPDWIVHLLLTFGLTCAAALFWEFAEWTADRALGMSCQLGLDDTMGDMLMGVIGGIVFSVPTAVRMQRKNAADKSSPASS